MRAHDVVRARRDGARVYYSIANPKLIQAFDLITEVMQESMDRRAKASEPGKSQRRGDAPHPQESTGVSPSA
jgi:hypothetical protein